MRPVGFREAAQRWGTADPELAFRLHALVGGPPEDRAWVGGAGPASLADLDPWVARWLLDPASPMFGAGGRALREASTAADPGALASVLAAISGGAVRAGQIAAALGQPGDVVDRLLGELAALGLVERLADPLGAGEDACVIISPVVRLHQLVIAPHETALAAGQAKQVWAAGQGTVAAWVYRPHFASVSRQWCLRHADPATLGGAARGARPVAIDCPEHGADHELEALVVEDPVATGRVLAIGATMAATPTGPAGQTHAASATGGTTDPPMDVARLEWLEHLRGLLPPRRIVPPPRLLLFSRSGFTPDLVDKAAARPDIELVGIDRIYWGA